MNTQFWSKILKRRYQLEDLGVNRVIILKQIFKEYDVVWSVWLRVGSNGCEHSNEPSGSMKGGELLTS
jgi:hypothetical protein